ncbi:MAG: ester cyclase [Vicinamibacterales bacterium]
MTREEILAFFERRQELWRRRDAAALAADHAEDSLVQSPTQALQRGREAIESVYRLWFTAFPDYQFLQEEVLIDGHRAVIIARVIGTHEGEFFGLPATGRRFECRVVFVYTLKNGEIVHERRILDFTGVLLQIGVLKARPA